MPEATIKRADLTTSTKPLYDWSTALLQLPVQPFRNWKHPFIQHHTQNFDPRLPERLHDFSGRLSPCHVRFYHDNEAVSELGEGRGIAGLIQRRRVNQDTIKFLTQLL